MGPIQPEYTAVIVTYMDLSKVGLTQCMAVLIAQPGQKRTPPQEEIMFGQ